MMLKWVKYFFQIIQFFCLSLSLSLSSTLSILMFRTTNASYDWFFLQMKSNMTRVYVKLYI